MVVYKCPALRPARGRWPKWGREATRRTGPAGVTGRAATGRRGVRWQFCSRLLYRGARNLDAFSRPSDIFLDGASDAVKTTAVSTEKARTASVMDIVPMAEDRRPAKGTLSGDRPHCMLRLMRPTWVASASMSGAAAFTSCVKMAACWPFQLALTAACTSEMSEYRATGMTGPNCSSWKMRMAGVTPSRSAGIKRAPARLPPPLSALASLAPLASASPTSSSR
mmetsp:Transcript_26691/g.78599  ORF Transcript_26691/g.78599 Transcript_26691/m.78599 type:complete len:223 (+) Transcript_26691:177-845(+)